MKRSWSTTCNEIQIDEADKPPLCAAFLQQYKLQARIGSGSQGQVWTAYSRASKQAVPVAVKALQMSKDAQTELKAHSMLREHGEHPHVLQLLFSFSDR